MRTGHLDVFVGNNNEAPNQVLLGNGDGTFAEAIELPGGSKSTYALIVGDADGDGDACLEARARDGVHTHRRRPSPSPTACPEPPRNRARSVRTFRRGGSR